MKYQAQPPPAQPHLHLLHQLLAQGYPHQVLINAQTPLTLKIPALIACNLYDDAISEILGQDLKEDEEICQLHLVWLSICCYMVNTEYTEYLDQLEKEGQDPRYAELVKQWIRQYKPVIHPQEIKISIRKKFQQLLLQAQQQNYYSLQRMPVYLLPTSWLQKFYSQSLQQIPSIDTTCLSTSSAYIEASPLHHHYNYNIKEQCKQNIDYKIISYEAWHYLFSIFGGTQFKRFNTNQKQAVCEIRYQKMKVVVVEERWLFGLRVFQIFVARFDTVESVIERVKNIMGDYAIADADSLALDWVPLLVSKMEVADLFNIIQDESRNLIKQASPKTHQIIQLLPTSDIQDIEYNQQKDILLLTLCQKQFPQWLDIRSLKKKPSTKKYPKCLTCSTAQPSLLQDCICKQAYFCSKQCRNKNKDHLKICQTLMKEETILNRLVDGFAIQKRKMKWLYVKKGGKVGLENLGNTCYMNAALQCVLSVEGLNAYFLGNRHLHELNVINVLGSGGELACAYGEFVKDYYTTTRRALEPIRILKIISSKNTQFRGHNHQDSQEFFNYFFDKLHQDLNRVREKPYIQNIQSDGRPDDVVSELSWSNYLKRNSSFISDNFAGQYRSEIKCPDCSRVSITFDPFLSVTLPFPKQQIHEQLVGYFLSKQGQFQKVQKKVKPSMPAQQFLQKFFNQPVHPLWLQKKQPLMQWKLKKSISSNNPGKGVLIFYEKPTNSTVQLQIKIEGYDIFHRKVFTQPLKQISDLKRQVYSSIKAPLLKATRKEEFIGIGLEEYIKRAVESQFIEIVQHSIKEFPFVQGVANLKIKIIQEKCPFPIIQKIKFDFSSRPYTAKIDFPVYRSLTDSITLTQLLRSFSQPEQLTQENSWYCNKCKGHKLAQKKMSLYNSAKYLVVHLKRFNHKGNRYVIYGEKVRMPVKLENIEIICGKKYKLFGVVNHYGSLSMGHYTAYVNREGEWYCADDSSFRKREVDGSDAYLLFYQSIEVEND